MKVKLDFLNGLAKSTKRLRSDLTRKETVPKAKKIMLNDIVKW